MTHDPQLAESLVTKMMAIPGRSGQEAAVADFIIQALRRARVPASAIARDQAHRRSPRGGDCGNVIVKLPGRGALARAARRMLMGHMDTVPICVGCKPVRRGGRVVSADPSTGLGADNRAGAAAVLVAALSLLKHKPAHPPLTLLWTVQEEVGLVGARHVAQAKLGKPTMAFNFDGGRPYELITGAIGADRMAIDIEGVASHAGVHPHRGVSALAVASLAIASLVRDGWHGRVVKGSRRGTSNVGVFNAGAATNVVNEHAHLRAEARSHNAPFLKRIVAAYRKAFGNAAKKLSNEAGQHAKVRFDISHDYDAFVLKKTEPCVKAAAASVADGGMTPTYRIVDGGLDANWMTRHGVPTVSLGVGQRDIHTVKESLDVKEFHAGCAVACRLAAGA